MAKSIKEVFQTECSHLKINPEFAKRVGLYERAYVNRSEDHIEFLGGVLLGTPPLRFYSTDRNAWFDEVMEADDETLKSELHALPTVDKDRNVSSDVLNLSLVWMVHALYNAPQLSARQKEEAMVATLRVMHYRFLSSLMAHYFRYEPDREIMEATYAALNYKFALKRAGSWSALIDQRTQDIISPKSIHIRTIQKFDNDEQILYMITDIQGRIREVVKKMYRVFVEVHRSGTKVKSRSGHVTLDGELHVRDLQRSNQQYMTYIHSTLVDRATFIRPELVRIVADAMHTMPEKNMVMSLEYMADNYGKRGDPRVAKLVDETVLHAFDYINNNRDEFRTSLSLVTLLSRLRSLYMSSRSNDPALVRIRDLAYAIVKRTVKSSNTSMLASVRTGVMLYVVLRTFAMTYYSTAVSTESRKPEDYQPQSPVSDAVLENVQEEFEMGNWDDVF